MSRDLTLVAIALVLWGVGEGMFLYFEPLYLQELGADPVLIGTILGIVGISMTVAHLPAGYLADRFGRRPLLRAAWLMGTLATALLALSTSLPMFVTGMTLYGLTSFVVVPLNSYVTAARGHWSVARALTLISATFNFGAILGPLLGGWIGDQVGLQRTFMIAAFLFLASTAVLFFIRPQPVERLPVELKGNSMRAVLTSRTLRFLFVVFIATFCMFLPQPLSQNFLQNERGIGLSQIGQLIAARSLGVVLLNLLLGQMNARAGYLLAQVGVGLFTVFLWHGSGLPWFLLGYFLLGSYQTARSLATAQSRSLVSSANMGITYGLIETAAALAIILAPPLAGLLYAHKPVWIYSISLLLIGLALANTIIFSPLRIKDVQS